MRNPRHLFIAGTLLIGASVAGSLALAAGDDHGTSTKEPAAKAPAKATKPAASPAKHDDNDHAPAKPASKATPKAEPSDDHVVETKPAPKAEAKSESKSDSKSESKASRSMSEEAPQTADAALEALKDGNARWLSGKVTAPNTGSDRRADVAANGQKPFATIYTCADSRLPVERIFDRGVGDVFVLRIAGNVIGEHSTGTIEYGVEHLHTPLLVIMGHTKCGAVKAACGGGHVGGSIDSLLTEISPAVERAKASNPDATPEQLVEFAVNENVWQSVFELLNTSEIVRNHVTEGKIKIVGAVCDISTCKVQFLGEHPWQNQLLQAMKSSGEGATTAKASTNEAAATPAKAKPVKDAHADEKSDH